MWKKTFVHWNDEHTRTSTSPVTLALISHVPMKRRGAGGSNDKQRPFSAFFIAAGPNEDQAIEHKHLGDF
jgi:hypothetical protein